MDKFNEFSDEYPDLREDDQTKEELRRLRDIRNQPDADLCRMVPILVDHAGSKDEFTMKTAIDWIKEFVVLGRERLLTQYADILAAILPCTAHAGNLAPQIQEAAFATNKVLLTMVNETTYPAPRCQQMITRIF